MNRMNFDYNLHILLTTYHLEKDLLYFACEEALAQIQMKVLWFDVCSVKTSKTFKQKPIVQLKNHFTCPTLAIAKKEVERKKERNTKRTEIDSKVL